MIQLLDSMALSYANLLLRSTLWPNSILNPPSVVTNPPSLHHIFQCLHSAYSPAQFPWRSHILHFAVSVLLAFVLKNPSRPWINSHTPNAATFPKLSVPALCWSSSPSPSPSLLSSSPSLVAGPLGSVQPPRPGRYPACHQLWPRPIPGRIRH